MEVWGTKQGKGWCDIDPLTNSFFLLGILVCANFGENQSKNATVRVPPDGQIHTLTDTNRFYNMSHAIYCSYGTDNYRKLR